MSKMNEDVRELWTGALRSNEYKQGFNYLREGDCFCANGVLIDLAIKAGVEVSVECDPRGFYKFNGASSTLPAPVRKWAEITDNYTHLGGFIGSRRASVADINDSGTSFADLADLIDAEL